MPQTLVDAVKRLKPLHAAIGLAVAVVLVVALVFVVRNFKSTEGFVASGDAFAAAGKHAEAVVQYRRALALDDKFGKAHFGLGKSYLALKDMQKAGIALIAASDLLPDSTDAQQAGLRFLVLSRRFKDALVRAERVLQQKPDSIEARLAKATALAGLERVDEAITEALLAVKSKPEPRTLVVAGDLLWRQKRLGEAEDNYKKAVEVDPKDVEPMIALGTFYWVSGRRDDAEGLFRRAAAAEPAREDLQGRLAGFLMATGRTAEAEAPLKALVAASGTATSRLALADYYVAAKRPDDARPLLEKLATEPGGFAGAKVRLTRLEYQLGRKTEAQQSLAELLAKEPKNADGLVLKAEYLLEEQKLDEALTVAKAAVAADMRSSVAHAVLGDVSATRNELDIAIGAFSEALKLDPRFVTVKTKLARLHLRKGAFPVALQLATEAANEAPNSLEASRVRVTAMAATGDRVGAERALTAIVAANPGFAVLHADLGEIFLAKREYTAAERAFDRALALAPTSLDALRGKVAVDILNGRTDRARAAVEQRLQALPSDKAVLLLAAGTYGALGDTARQEATLNRLAALDDFRNWLIQEAA